MGSSCRGKCTNRKRRPCVVALCVVVCVKPWSSKRARPVERRRAAHAVSDPPKTDTNAMGKHTFMNSVGKRLAAPCTGCQVAFSTNTLRGGWVGWGGRRGGGGGLAGVCWSSPHSCQVLAAAGAAGTNHKLLLLQHQSITPSTHFMKSSTDTSLPVMMVSFRSSKISLRPTTVSSSASSEVVALGAKRRRSAAAAPAVSAAAADDDMATRTL